MQLRLTGILPLTGVRVRTIRAAAIAAVLAWNIPGAQRVKAQVIDFSGGFTGAGDVLTANGINGTPYFPAYSFYTLARLTTGHASQAASLFSNDRVDITSFTNTFTFDILDGGTLPNISDGITFCIQGNNPMALGPGGGGLGYGPDHPGSDRGILNSVAIKFKTFENAGETDNSTGLFTDGRSPTIPEPGTEDRNDPIDKSVLDLKSQHPFRVNMTYDGIALTVTITDTVTGSSFTPAPYPVDIPSHVGGNTGYVGFTAGTGGTTAVQDIESWTFQSGP